MAVFRRTLIAIAILSGLSRGIAIGAETPLAAEKSLLDLAPGNAGLVKCLAPSSAQVTAAPSKELAAPGLVVTIQPGRDNYPGVGIKPEVGSTWDLSHFGRIEVTMTNLGTKPLAISLRVDNAGDWRIEPWDAEQLTIEPKKTGAVTVVFGYSYGHKPGFKLDAAKVVQLLLFAAKSDGVQSFRIDSVKAAGVSGEKPPVDPDSIRVKPKNGVLLGGGVVIDAQKQIEATGAKATALVGENRGIQITFDGEGAESRVAIRPAVGRWDLREAIEVRVRVRNAGSIAFAPCVCLDCGGVQSEWIKAGEPLEAGAEQEMTIEFGGAVPWQPVRNVDRTSWSGKPGTGSLIVSDAVSAVVISADQPAAGAVLTVESITAGVAADLKLPKWLGKRPPVDGDWVKTFDDEFDATALDLTKWNNTGENYYDSQTHWSKNNVIIGGGVARLRYEKKIGRQNDIPTGKETTYACGYLDTLGKFVQRYGYFEARMKLPRAPGLWPAFWMMPDRGAKADQNWDRQDTGNGGMEFDIMEHLSRWGPYRYNISMHWDGYGKDHKQTGTERIYLQPDKDGFIVCGLLWTPGRMVLYGNGHIVAAWDDPRVSSVQSDMMFTLPMGGWDNDSLDDSKLPADFEIDYVRVWQCRDLMKQSGK